MNCKKLDHQVCLAQLGIPVSPTSTFIGRNFPVPARRDGDVRPKVLPLQPSRTDAELPDA